MKSVFYIILLALLFSLSTFSQDRIHIGVLPDKPTNDRLREIHKPNVDDLQGLNDIDSLLLKSKSSDWQTVLRNPQSEVYEVEGFDAKDTRTTINKTLLGNGFLLIEEIYQYWDNSNWMSSAKGSFIYDESNNLTEFLHQYWGGPAWVNEFKYSYTYDGNNNLAESLYQTWNISAWVNDIKWSYTYDSNNNLIEGLEQGWDDSTWVNYYKNSFIYDGNNNRTEWLYQTWNSSAWVNSWKYSFTYDGNNNSTESLYQTWDGSTWVNSYKSFLIYDGNNNLTESLVKRWYGSDWANHYKYSYTYDGNNNQIESLGQTPYGYAWVNDWKFSYLYDGNNNQTESISQDWDGYNWVNLTKTSSTYVPVTAINQELSFVNSYSLSNNYPNPFNPSTKITYTIPERCNVSLKVYDLLGSEVEELVKGEIEAGAYDITFNASNLSSGIYFYRLQAGSFVETKKMILMK